MEDSRKITRGWNDSVAMMSLYQEDQVRRNKNQKQRNAEPDQDGAGEEQPHQVPQRIRLHIVGDATHQDLHARIHDRLREIQPVLALGCDRNGCDPEIRPPIFHGVEQFLDIGHDDIFRLPIQAVSDAAPEFDAKAA